MTDDYVGNRKPVKHRFICVVVTVLSQNVYK